MATPFSFQSLNFNNIPGREIEANRRYTAGLEGMFKSIGEGAKDIAGSYMSEEERKKREAEDKKKWDNMIAQQEYQKRQNELAAEHQASREAVADARYNNEWNVKQEERRIAEAKRMEDRAALDDYKKGLKDSYTPEFLAKYGPSALSRYNASMSAKTYAEAVAEGDKLANGIYQQDLMDFQREQAHNAESKDAEYKKQLAIKNAVQSGLFKNGIDITGTRLPKTKEEAQAQIGLIETYLGNDFLGGIDTFDGTAGTGELAFKLLSLKELLSKVGTPKKKPPRTWEKTTNTNL